MFTLNLFVTYYSNKFNAWNLSFLKIDKCEIAEICYTMKTSKERGILCD